MDVKFIGFVYYEGRLLCMAEDGDVYELNVHHPGGPTWSLLSRSPFPRHD